MQGLVKEKGFLVSVFGILLFIEGDTFIVNPRHACATRVTVVGLSVCVSGCRRLLWHYRLQGGLLVIDYTSLKNKRAIFLKQLHSRDML